MRSTLTRGVGLWSATAVNVANMIGTGVFLKSRVMTCNVGSARWVLAAWLAAGLLALAGTFAYAELGAMMPEAGGDYVYLRRAYGRLTGFLYGWISFTVARAGSQAALAVGLAIFMNVALGGALARWHLGFGPAGVGGLSLAALAAIWTVALVNCASVAAGGRVALILTIAKVLLVIAVGAGAFALGTGDWAHLGERELGGACEGVVESARGGVAGFGAAMLGALWAYDGWQNVAPLSGEVKDPQRNLPRALVGGTLIVMALYLFANLGYFYALTPTAVASVPASSSVATEVLKRFLGPMAVSLMAVALMVSSFGALQSSVLANSRVPFAMARDGLFFRALGSLSPRTNVPVRAILAQAVWASLLALSGSYDTLTDSVIFASWLFYGSVAASVFVFRVKQPDAPRPYRAFGYPVVPLIFVAVTAFLLINTFVATPRQALEGVVLLVAGLPFYWYWSRHAPR
ncbi:MAG TPA: amino acid permease [Steroidobacteraceae bacterium]|nr:amino acid permease [Steroidobacteraceae bacterium]